MRPKRGKRAVCLVFFVGVQRGLISRFNHYLADDLGAIRVTVAQCSGVVAAGACGSWGNRFLMGYGAGRTGVVAGLGLEKIGSGVVAAGARGSWAAVGYELQGLCSRSVIEG